MGTRVSNMQKIRAFLKGLFNNPLEKLEKISYAVVFLMALAGLGMGFLSFSMQSAFFGFDFSDFLGALLTAVILAVIYGFIGWIVGLSLRCYVFFLRNHKRQADATEQIALYLTQSAKQYSDSSVDV